MNGRPPRYTPELAQHILNERAKGRRLLHTCSEPGMPSTTTVENWVKDDIDGFAARWHEAGAAGAALIQYPTLFSDELTERLIGELASGRTVKDVSKDPGMPSVSTIQRWVAANPGEFAARFREAQEIGRALRGGPVRYSAELTDRVLGELMSGRLLVDVCELPGMPCVATVMLWVKRDVDGFAARYNEAREIGAHLMADHLVKIGDDVARDAQGEPSRGAVELAKVRTDSRKWMLSKVLPRFFGNRIEVIAKQDVDDGWEALLKRIDGQSRGFPKEEDPTDE